MDTAVVANMIGIVVTNPKFVNASLTILDQPANCAGLVQLGPQWGAYAGMAFPIGAIVKDQGGTPYIVDSSGNLYR